MRRLDREPTGSERAARETRKRAMDRIRTLNNPGREDNPDHGAAMPAKSAKHTKHAKSAKSATKAKTAKPKPPLKSASFPAARPAPGAMPRHPQPPALRTAVERATPQAPTHLLKLGAPKPGEIKTVEAAGPLLLLGAQVVMGNAAAGVSQIGLEIDGELVMVLRPDQHAARGLTMPNATGAFVTHASFGNCWTTVLGWPYPVRAGRQVKVSVMVMEEIGELEMALLLGRP
jgi:hypothetical protein